MSQLARFFSAVKPLLLGQTSVDAAEAELGPSPSGSENLDFYRVLISRNYFKILRDLYGPVRTLALRQGDGLWATLVRGYIADGAPSGRGANDCGAGFSEWLAQRRESVGDIPELFEELADYQWIRYLAYGSPDDVGDGFEQRLFVRQYTHEVPKIATKLGADETAELPERTPVVALVYRHLETQNLQVFYPTRVGLAVLARRQGADLPPGFGGFTDAVLRGSELEMVKHGILVE